MALIKESIKFIPCLFTIFLLFIIYTVRCEPEVKMLHVMFRHGDKVPHAEYQNYPNDPYSNHSYYPISDGGLTNEGKMKEYKIGKMLRERYDDFLGPIYWPDEIYARSSHIPRAQMSLQLVLAALYPPVGHQVWNPDLLWQPVVTFNEPWDKDFFFFPQCCPLYQAELRNFLKEEEPRRLIDEHRGTMEYLTKHSGKPINSTEDVYFMYNLLKEQKAQNLALPEWTSKVFPEPMKTITTLHFKFSAATTTLKRLGGGNMLRKITEDMKGLRKKIPASRGKKLFFFSGHEDSVARLAYALGTNEPRLPDYGSSIIIETLQDREKNDSYFVRVLFWPGAITSEIITQTLPDCSEICPLEKFLRILKDVIPNESESQCSTETKNSNSGSALSTKFYTSAVFTILLIIINL